jgi:hypothetical protein
MNKEQMKMFIGRKCFDIIGRICDFILAVLMFFSAKFCKHENIDLIDLYFQDQHVQMKCRRCKKIINAFYGK